MTKKNFKTSTRVVSSVKKTVINANYPPKGVSRKKLEEIWGDGKDIVPLRERNFDKRKHKFEPSPV